MRYKVFSVRDRAADVFGQPFYTATKGTAIRSFSDEINRRAEGNQLNAHPEDFDLFFLGEFDDEKGVFECGEPEQIAIGKDVKV